jgi:hypothetical protein
MEVIDRRENVKMEKLSLELFLLGIVRRMARGIINFNI